MLADDSSQGSKRNAASTPTKKLAANESSVESSPTDHHALFLKAYRQGRAKMAANSGKPQRVPSSGSGGTGGGNAQKVPTLNLKRDADADRVAKQVSVVNEIERATFQEKSRSDSDSDKDVRFSSLNVGGGVTSALPAVQNRTPVKNVSLKQLAASFGKSLDEHEKAIKDVELSTTSTLQMNPLAEIEALNRQLQQFKQTKQEEEDNATPSPEPVAASSHLLSSEVIVEADMGFQNVPARPRAPRQLIGIQRDALAPSTATYPRTQSSGSEASTGEKSLVSGGLLSNSTLGGGMTLSELSGTQSSWKLSTTEGLASTIGSNMETVDGGMSTDDKVKKQLAELEAVLQGGHAALMGGQGDDYEKNDPVVAARQAGEQAAALRERLKLNLPGAKADSDSDESGREEGGGTAWLSAKAGLRAELQLMQELQQRESTLDTSKGKVESEKEEDPSEPGVVSTVGGGAPWTVYKDKLKAEVQRMRQQLLLAQQARWCPSTSQNFGGGAEKEEGEEGGKTVQAGEGEEQERRGEGGEGEEGEGEGEGVKGEEKLSEPEPDAVEKEEEVRKEEARKEEIEIEEEDPRKGGGEARDEEPLAGDREADAKLREEEEAGLKGTGSAGVFTEGAVPEEQVTVDIKEVGREERDYQGDRKLSLISDMGPERAEENEIALADERLEEAILGVGQACRLLLFLAVPLGVFGIFSPWSFACWGVAVPLALLSGYILSRSDALQVPSDSAFPRPLITYTMAFNFIAALSLLAVILCASGSQSIVPLLKTPVCNAPPTPSDDASSAPFPLVNGSSVSPAANTFASDTPAPSVGDLDVERALGGCQAWGLCGDGGTIMIGCSAMRGMTAWNATLFAVLALALPSACALLSFKVHTRLQERERIHARALHEPLVAPADVSVVGLLRAVSASASMAAALRTLSSAVSTVRRTASTADTGTLDHAAPLPANEGALRHPSWDAAEPDARDRPLRSMSFSGNRKQTRGPNHAPASDPVGDTRSDHGEGVGLV